MKNLRTSAGIKNPSIHTALVDLLGKPIAEASALCIPTAIYPFSVGLKNAEIERRRQDAGDGEGVGPGPTPPRGVWGKRRTKHQAPTFMRGFLE